MTISSISSPTGFSAGSTVNAAQIQGQIQKLLQQVNKEEQGTDDAKTKALIIQSLELQIQQLEAQLQQAQQQILARQAASASAQQPAAAQGATPTSGSSRSLNAQA